MRLRELFKRKKGGTRLGNFLRRTINNYTLGISDALGLTDGHRVDGVGDDDFKSLSS